MTPEMIDQLFNGCLALYLFFMSYNFTVDNFMAFVLFKFIPFFFALTLTISELKDAGYIIKV